MLQELQYKTNLGDTIMLAHCSGNSTTCGLKTGANLLNDSFYSSNTMLAGSKVC